MDKPYFLPDKYAMKKKIDRLEQQLAKANERVKELEQENNILDTALIGAERSVEDEIKALNKFAIEKKIEALESLNNKYRVQTYPIQAMRQLLALELEQLRKEKE